MFNKYNYNTFGQSFLFNKFLVVSALNDITIKTSEMKKRKRDHWKMVQLRKSYFHSGTNKAKDYRKKRKKEFTEESNKREKERKRERESQWRVSWMVELKLPTNWSAGSMVRILASAENLSVLPSFEGSDGKAEDSGLKGLGFNPPPRQEICSCFQLVALEPLRSVPLSIFHMLQIHMIINSHRNGGEGTLFP